MKMSSFRENRESYLDSSSRRCSKDLPFVHPVLFFANFQNRSFYEFIVNGIIAALFEWKIAHVYFGHQIFGVDEKFIQFYGLNYSLAGLMIAAFVVDLVLLIKALPKILHIIVFAVLVELLAFLLTLLAYYDFVGITTILVKLAAFIIGLTLAEYPANLIPPKIPLVVLALAAAFYGIVELLCFQLSVLSVVTGTVVLVIILQEITSHLTSTFEGRLVVPKVDSFISASITVYTKAALIILITITCRVAIQATLEAFK